MKAVVHILTHSLSGVSHSFPQVNQGSEQHFYRFSSALPCGYYYYLDIYKFRFQADRFHIRFPLLINTYMDLRATA